MARRSNRSRIRFALPLLATPLLLAGGCSDAEAGSLLGAGLGALAGQAIGGNTEATLIGTAVGAGAGYIIGNEQDKRRYHGHDYHHGRRSYNNCRDW